MVKKRRRAKEEMWSQIPNPKSKNPNNFQISKIQ
jgi:hypothetical protein